MAKFITKCPHCNNNLQVQDEWIGMELECPLCRQKFVIAPGKTAKPPFESDEKNCPFCGEKIKKQAVYCKHCKTDFTKTAQRSINPYPKGIGNYIQSYPSTPSGAVINGPNPKGIGNDIQSYPSTPSGAVINKSAPSVLEIILFVIGILFISKPLVFILANLGVSVFSYNLLSWIWGIFALIGCIISIIYFVVQDVRAKKIHWEYLGIVMSFENLFWFIDYIIIYIKNSLFG